MADYKALLLSQRTADVIITDRISGLNAAFMRGSIAARGLDPDNLPPPEARFKAALPDGLKAWRDIWSAGHGVGLIDDNSDGGRTDRTADQRIPRQPRPLTSGVTQNPQCEANGHGHLECLRPTAIWRFQAKTRPYASSALGGRTMTILPLIAEALAALRFSAP